MNLNTTVEERYGKAIVFIDKVDYLINEKASKAVALIAKQKNYQIIDFQQHIAIF